MPKMASKKNDHSLKASGDNKIFYFEGSLVMRTPTVLKHYNIQQQ